MSESVPENPYASPAGSPAPSQPRSATTDFWPTAFVPRWWEWMSCVLLLGAFGAIAWDSVYVMNTGTKFWRMDANPFDSDRNFVSSAIGVGLGLMVLRIWWWRQLPGRLAPGHVILLTILYTSLVSIGGYVLLVATFQIALLTPPGIPSSFADENTTFLIGNNGYIVSGLGACVILLTLLPRKSLWFAAAGAYLFQWLLPFSYLLLSSEQFNYFMQDNLGATVLRFLLYTAWYLVMFSFVILAIHERWRGIRRDWLHWAGIVCWASFLVVGIAEDIWWNLE